MTNRVTYKLKIADIHFFVDTYPDKYTEEIFAPYLTDEDADNAVHVECILTQEEIVAPVSTKLTDRERNEWYSEADGKYTVCFRDLDKGFVCARFDYDNNTKSARVIMLDVEKLHGIDTEFFLSNILENLFRLVLVFEGGFVVHASSIVHEGYGLAFSALSGTGKSTHTALWQEVYPGTEILNDDGPALRKRDGVWHIYGTPWAGTSGININVAVPLKSLVFLERSDVNTIRVLSALESIRRIFEAIIHPVSDELMNLVLSTLSDFISQNELCVLGCNISHDAPRTVKEFLYK